VECLKSWRSKHSANFSETDVLFEVDEHGREGFINLLAKSSSPSVLTLSENSLKDLRDSRGMDVGVTSIQPET